MSKTHHILTSVLVCLICVTSATSSEVRNQTITFLNKKQAAAAIVDDSLEPYFDQLQPMEMAAKTGEPLGEATIDKQRMLCRQRYQAGVLGFTEAEQVAIQFYIDKLQPVLIKDYPLIGTMPWSFLKVSDSIEGGLPYTRGRHIVLSKSMCNQMAMMQQLPPEHIAHVGMLELLTHEQMHVFQRTHPGHCDSLYKGLWGFEKADAISGCKWLIKHHLANPDAVDCRWVLPIKKGQTTKYLWPLVVFSEGNRFKKMPGDFRMIVISVTKENKGFAVQVTNDGRPVFQDLQQTPEFRELFPVSSNIYHPDEASADMFAKIVIFDNFIPANALPPAKRNEMNKNLAALREWFKKNCKNPTKTSSVRGEPRR